MLCCVPPYRFRRKPPMRRIALAGIRLRDLKTPSPVRACSSASPFKPPPRSVSHAFAILRSVRPARPAPRPRDGQR
jgi:hypothetical protein